MSPPAITPTAPGAPSGSPRPELTPAAALTPDLLPSPRHWVISDVHGCADSLLDLVALLPASDRLVLCGDVINRGPRIQAAMELAWHLVESGRGVWLMGNHEQRLVQLLRGEACGDRQLLAGSDTYRQLGGRSCRRWLERLEQLPLVHWGEGWAATHAGFDPLTWQPHLTVRMAFWQHYDGRFGKVIVGHTPAPKVRHIRDIVLIDTGACYGGPLTAYCPETGVVRQVQGLSGDRPGSSLSLPLLLR
jgi:serine/threonine protein phosphatase 1